MEKVVDPTKIVTDELVLKRLTEQGIDKDYVEFFQDYATRRIAGGRSPYTKTYRDLKSGMRILVSQGLPMVDAYGFKHELRWRERNGVIENGNNLFHSIISNGTIRIIVLSDQPNGVKKDTELSYHAQLLINGSEILPTSVVPLILATDPINPDYHDNVLFWQYDTICRRRVRIIEGRYREKWLIDRHPNGRVEIRHNKTGALKLKLGIARDAAGEILKVRVVGDSEIVEASEFDGKTFPVEIGASPETFFPDAHPETSSADGRTAKLHSTGSGITWNALVNIAGDYFDDSQSNDWFYFHDTASQKTKNLERSGFTFDTSPLPDGATVSGADLSLYLESKIDEGTANTPDIGIVGFNPSDPTQLQAADFTQFGTVEFSNVITYASLNVGSYNVFTLIDVDANNFGYISKIATTKLGARNINYDVAEELSSGADDPVWSSGSKHGADHYFSEKGSGFKPKLVVTYMAGWAGGDVLGVDIATIAEINGVALADISEVNGVA